MKWTPGDESISRNKKNRQSIMLTKGPAKIRQLPIYQQLLITAEVQSIEV